MRTPLTLLAPLSIALILASCGGPSSTQNAVAPDESTTSIASLPVDPQLTRSAISEQATEPYNITLQFAAGSDASVVSAMQAAAKRWEGVVTQGLPSYSANIKANTCGSNAAYVGSIDDLLVFTGNKAIDGPGGILAQSGPCSVRTSGGLTIYSTLVFDTADLAQFKSQLAEIAVHELGHSLGIGTLWQSKGLVSGIGTTNPIYKGTNGVREYRAAGGTLTTVPVENQGGAGTAGGHWRETTFKTELMTGYLNSGVVNPLSRMSVGSLQDMGYAVNYAAADAYTVPAVAAASVNALELGGQEELITPTYRGE